MYNLEIIKYIPGWLDEGGAALLYKYAMEAPVPNLLEIGTFCGKSACVLAQAVHDKQSGSLVCMDRFDMHVNFKFNYANPEEPMKTIPDTLMATINNLKKLGLYQHAIIIKGDHAHTLNQVNGNFGFIYIDGGHHTERVIADCIFAWKQLAVGGHLALHDYGHPKLPDVKRVVDVMLHVWDAKIIAQEGITVIIKKEKT